MTYGCDWATVPAIGLEVQAPWADAILRGEKAVETRSYPLPDALLGRPLWMLESVSGAACVSSIPDLVPAGDSRMRVTGAFKVVRQYRYESAAVFAAEEPRHLVSPTNPYAWCEDRRLWAWVVEPITPSSDDVSTASLPPCRRRLRSLFELEGFPACREADQNPNVSRQRRDDAVCRVLELLDTQDDDVLLRYWAELCPALHVCDAARQGGLPAVAPADFSTQRRQVDEHGYTQLAPRDSGLAAPMLSDVAAAAEALHHNGWPATFLIVFDGEHGLGWSGIGRTEWGGKGGECWLPRHLLFATQPPSHPATQPRTYPSTSPPPSPRTLSNPLLSPPGLSMPGLFRALGYHANDGTRPGAGEWRLRGQPRSSGVARGTARDRWVQPPS